MVLSEFREENPDFRFSLLATDISTQALQTAVRGIYDLERVNTVPPRMKSRYLLKSKDRKKKLVRMAPEIRRLVEFRRLNFMDDFELDKPMDIIFCRNVVIYFDKPTQEVLFNKFCQQLMAGGHLFIGHSESLAGMELPLRQVAPTVYQRI
jgi:chemotaxis protein methyltransferase CheR